jgi:hypothetical protein
MMCMLNKTFHIRYVGSVLIPKVGIRNFTPQFRNIGDYGIDCGIADKKKLQNCNCGPSKIGLPQFRNFQLLLIFSVCLSACRSACLSVYMSVCPPICLSVCPPACLSVGLPVCLSACLPVCRPACLSLCLLACLPVCQPVSLPHCRLPVCLSACLPSSVYLSACVSAYLSACMFVLRPTC